MSDAKHTPSPWETDERTGLIDGVMELEHDADGTRLQMSPADRRLVEAAPDLLEVLEDLVIEAEQKEYDPTTERRLSAARAAIAKARGES